MAAAEVAYAPPMKSGKAGFEGGVPEVQHRIRITLSSRNVKNLEKGTRTRRTVLALLPHEFFS
jgi:small subunit ribosomal protein S20e